MRISRTPLYFSSQPRRIAPRGRWRLLILAALGGVMVAGGAAIGSGVARETPSDAVAAALPLETSARNGLAIAPWEEAPAEPVLAEAIPFEAPLAAPAPAPEVRDALVESVAQQIDVATGELRQGGPMPSIVPGTPGIEQLWVTGTVRGLVLRASPSTASLRIGLIADGAVITSLGNPVAHEGRTWRPVRTRDGDEGWVADEYLRRAAR